MTHTKILIHGLLFLAFLNTLSVIYLSLSLARLPQTAKTLDQIMENSTNSSMNPHLSSNQNTDSPEESGWTTYFEDFFSKNREHNSCSSGLGSPSLVSDAASCAAWKLSDNNDHVIGYSSMIGPEKSSKKLNFMKRRSRGESHDDALEDTASSPVNSPKISHFKHLDVNPRKGDDPIDISKGKGSTSINFNCPELPTDERNESGFNIGKENECTELKKRGLCLVPLSMLVNYLE